LQKYYRFGSFTLSVSGREKYDMRMVAELPVMPVKMDSNPSPRTNNYKNSLKTPY
jgi:hypothetical protein